MAKVERLLNLKVDDPVPTRGLSLFDGTVAETIGLSDESATSARVLEFDSLRELLRAYTNSPLGQSRIAELAPSTDRAWIEIQQQLASEIREFRRTGGRFDFQTWYSALP